MKWGEIFLHQSVPAWAPYNVDYDELKLMIFANTSKRSITVPGQPDLELERFEEVFFAELCSQHDRVDLFVRSKADEFSRRLKGFQKKTVALLARTDNEQPQRITARRKEKFSKLETKILECGEEIKNLERFVSANQTAFRKIIKKYQKWTDTKTLGPRFTEDVQSNPKGFTRRDFTPLKNQYNAILTLIRQSSPTESEASTPLTQSRRASRQESGQGSRRQKATAPAPQQAYWNEYDNGSEAGEANEPYTVFVESGNDVSFPGADTISSMYAQCRKGVMMPVKKFREWRGSSTSAPDERQPLMRESGTGFFIPQASSSTLGLDTEADDNGSTSSSDFPSGYNSHYASFPSVRDQRLRLNREKLIFQSTVGCMLASFILLGISALLVATGRHKLLVEVDAGVIVGVVASLLFSTVGFSTMIYRWQRISWVQRASVAISFLIECVVSGVLLLLVMENTSL